MKVGRGNRELKSNLECDIVYVSEVVLTVVSKYPCMRDFRPLAKLAGQNIIKILILTASKG